MLVYADCLAIMFEHGKHCCYEVSGVSIAFGPLMMVR